MNLYTSARKYVDLKRLRRLKAPAEVYREEKIKNKEIAEAQKQQEMILAELKQIEMETSSKFCNWRRELEEGMTTAAISNTVLGPSDTPLENIDISDNTELSSNASVTSGGGGTGYNTGLNMGAEMISISGTHSSSKTFTLGTVDTSRATTITFKSLQGDYTNGGMANTNDTKVFFVDENDTAYLITTIKSNYVGYFIHSGSEHPDYPFKAGLFDTMSASQEADLRSDYSDWISGGFQADVQFQIFGKIVRYLGDQQQITTHTYDIPSSAGGKGRVIITQESNNGTTWTNDMGFSNFELRRNYPINVIVGLDDPEANNFVRTNPHLRGLSAEQRKKKLLEMLKAGDEYLLKQLGMTGSSARPQETVLQQSFMDIRAGGERITKKNGKTINDTTRRIKDGMMDGEPFNPEPPQKEPPKPPKKEPPKPPKKEPPKPPKKEPPKPPTSRRGYGLTAADIKKLAAADGHDYTISGDPNEIVYDMSYMLGRSNSQTQQQQNNQPKKQPPKPLSEPPKPTNTKTSKGPRLANAGPSTPVKVDSDGRIVPNQGGGRPSNIRLQQGPRLANAGPSTPVKVDTDGRIVPNQGGGRPGNIRPQQGPRLAAGGNPRGTGGTSAGDPENIKWPRNRPGGAPPGPGYRPPQAGRRQPQYAHYQPDGEVIVEKKKLKSPKDIASKIPGYYDGKPAPLGFPMDEPPKMVNGFHPDLIDGKKVADRFNKMDPISARSMPATGNPHIDKKVEAARKKKK